MLGRGGLSAPINTSLSLMFDKREKNDGLEEERNQDGRPSREERGAARRKGDGARGCDENGAAGYDDDGEEESRRKALIRANGCRLTPAK